MCKLFGYIQNHEISALKRIFGLSDPETFLIDLYEKPSFTLKILFARSVFWLVIMNNNIIHKMKLPLIYKAAF